MRYLKTFENLSELEQEDFINEIKSYFQDIIDKYSLDDVSDELDPTEVPGIFYDFYFNTHHRKPFLEILLWCGIDHADRFQKMGADIYRFNKMLEGMGYRVECQNMREFMETISEDSEFDIKVYYK